MPDMRRSLKKGQKSPKIMKQAAVANVNKNLDLAAVTAKKTPVIKKRKGVTVITTTFPKRSRKGSKAVLKGRRSEATPA